MPSPPQVLAREDDASEHAERESNTSSTAMVRNAKWGRCRPHSRDRRQVVMRSACAGGIRRTAAFGTFRGGASYCLLDESAYPEKCQSL